MTEFLRQVAATFVNKIGSDLSEYCFVFPNRRSSLFFKKYLGLSSNVPVFAPKIETISSLLTTASGLVVDSKVSLLYILYQTYLDVANSVETFDEFLHKGDTILNDFDDVDKYIVDAKMLFTNIAELREIGGDYSFLSDSQKAAIRDMAAFQQFWDTLISNKEGENEKFFTNFWTNMYELYCSFREKLEQKGKAYEGMVYRSVAEHLKTSELTAIFKHKHYVFVGFNALNNCEKKILNTLRDAGLADFYWDYYGEMIQDKMNMSSFFMKENVLVYPSKYQLISEEVDTNYNVVGVSSAIGQAKLLKDILHKLLPQESAADLENKAFRTAIVLPDEGLLLPVINSIPEYIEKVNVTMGYSLSNSSIAAFISYIADLFTKLKIEGSRVLFYHKSVLGLLKHPFVMKNNRAVVIPLIEKITTGNMVFVDSGDLQVSELCSTIFDTNFFFSGSFVSVSIAAMIEYEQKILSSLQSLVAPIDREFVYQTYIYLNTLKDLDLQLSSATFFRFQQQMMSSISIPFRGEPMAGLQIMGPLETRVLDFDNLIILSVNEGVFPKKSISTSLIPYNLRRGFDLPNYEFQDAIAAYHFYRSIYRASNVYMLYDTRTVGMNIGEESRFIKQLRYHHKVNLKESFVKLSAQKTEIIPKEIKKSEKILNKLRTRYYSASSLETYMSCSLKFYYQAIEKVKEEEEVRESVQADMFGSIYHKVMESIYNSVKDKPIEKVVLESFTKSQLEQIIEEVFKKLMQLDRIEGYNKVTAALLLRYVQKTLEEDIKLTPFTFVEAEKDMFFPIHFDELGCSLNFVGYIDRIDKVDGLLRIIDYKTGGVKIDFREVAEIFDRERENRPYTAFQLCFYLFLLLENGYITSPESAKLVVYTIKTIFRQSNPEMMLVEDQYAEFRERLLGLFAEILDPDIPFKAEGGEKACEYCLFKTKCGR